MASFQYDDAGGRYRWRNRIPDPETDAKAGSWSIVHNEADQLRWLGEISEALATVGYFRRPVINPWEAGDFGQVVLRWAEVASAARRWSKTTIVHQIKHINGLLRDLREALALPADSQIPTSKLTRTLCEDLGIRWANSDTPHSAYRRSVTLREAWDYAIHQDVPGIPPKNYAPVVSRETSGIAEAPSIVQVDRMLACIKNPTVYLAAALESRTGLRIAQVCALRVEDVDPVAWTVRITPGNAKSKQEKQGRTVPLSRALQGMPEFRDALQGIPQARVVRIGDQAIRAGVIEAWVKSGVPERFYNPPEHLKGRSSHALRAAFCQHLSDEAVSDTIIQYLIGHVGGSTLRASYAGRVAREDRLREAVDMIPALPVPAFRTPVGESIRRRVNARVEPRADHQSGPSRT